jgi:ribosomal protein S18 acetylase RimI-like enzyme
LPSGVAPGVELRPTIDRAWLEAAAEREPIEHAYSLWDLDRFPERVRFVSALRDGTTEGYLLIWFGPSSVPVVHWHGGFGCAEQLADALPPRPLVAIVPPEVREAVRAVRGDGREFPERLMLRPPDAPPVAAPATAAVRRLEGSDRAEAAAWARRQEAPLAREYAVVDPALEAVWGAFHDARLVGAARAAVRLPREWVVASVYVEPAARRHGLGVALLTAIVAASAEAGARIGLYVRVDAPDAQRVYDRLGFRESARRVWIDMGTQLEP